MALSNIRNEPRREITESLMGIFVVSAVLTGSYFIANYLNSLLPERERCPTVLGMLLVVIVVCLLYLLVLGLLYGTHALGELICNGLARRGLELRPRRR